MPICPGLRTSTVILISGPLSPLGPNGRFAWCIRREDIAAGDKADSEDDRRRQPAISSDMTMSCSRHGCSFPEIGCQNVGLQHRSVQFPAEPPTVAQRPMLFFGAVNVRFLERPEFPVMALLGP